MDYKNGKIYRVVCSETNRQYIGSTCSTLVKRMYQHKHKKSNECMTKDFIDGKIFLIEDYPCERKEQLHSRERFYIESMECVNIRIPTRTIKEYLEANKEQISQRKKEYHEKNKEQINQKVKEWNQKNKEKIQKRKSQKIQCDCGMTYTYGHKSRHMKSNKHQAYLSSIV